MLNISILLIVLGLGDSLRAGAASRAITPELDGGPVYLAGYGAGRAAEVINDDIWARALVLESGDRRVAFVAVDLIGFFLSDVALVRLGLPPETRIDHLVVASTHTHSGPDTIGLWGPTHFLTGRSEDYVTVVRQRILEAVSEAASRLEPAVLRLAQNRVEGLIRDSRPPLVIDDLLQVMALDRPAGGTIATLTCYPVHPEVLGSGSHLLSSDFPHYLRQRIETERGGVALHFSGSIGGLMAPRGHDLVDPEVGEPPMSGSLEMMRLYGERLAREALELLEDADSSAAAPLRYRARTVRIPLDNGYYRLAIGLGVVGGRPLLTEGRVDERRTEPLLPEFPRYPLGSDLETEISVVELGPASFAMVPGEIYPEITLGRIPAAGSARRGSDFPDAEPEPALRSMLPGDYRFVIGLANDEIGYIIPKSQWDEDAPWTYGRSSAPYGEINSVGPEAGPRLLAAFQELLSR